MPAGGPVTSTTNFCRGVDHPILKRVNPVLSFLRDPNHRSDAAIDVGVSGGGEGKVRIKKDEGAKMDPFLAGKVGA